MPGTVPVQTAHRYGYFALKEIGIWRIRTIVIYYFRVDLTTYSSVYVCLFLCIVSCYCSNILMVK